MKIVFSAMLLFILFPLAFAQGPGQPFFPETANGASNVSYQFHSLRWQNPENTVYNEVYLSFDSAAVADLDPSALYVSGYPSTVFDSIRINQQLFYPTRYFWCVVENDADGFTEEDTWYFTTSSGYVDYVKMDDFSFGLGRWTIGGSTACKWQSGEEINYTLPDPANGKVMTADASLCGGMIISTATFETADNMEYMLGAFLEFNSDWFTNNPVDYATVEASTDGGSSWTLLWFKAGVSDRNQHISLSLFDGNWTTDTIYTVRVRFSTFQNGGISSWWALDNVTIIAYDGILTHNHPYITSVNVNYDGQPTSIINWQHALPVPGDIIQRKEGTPLSNDPYHTIATVPASYTNTYIDSTVSDSTIYTYRIGYPEGWYVYSNEATAYVYPPVPVELVSFRGNIVNGDVVLNWVTATELNNKGFEVERSQISEIRSQNEWKNVGFVEGNGTTTRPNSYSFTDENLTSGKYRYRLKQIDFNGTFKYSNVVDIEVNLSEEFSLSQNFPNPFNPVTIIKYSIPAVGTSFMKFVQLKVYDALGNEVATLVNEEQPAGIYSIKFDGSRLSSGVYFYKLKAGNLTAAKKLILIK